MIYYPCPELPYDDTLAGVKNSLWFHAWRNYSMLEYIEWIGIIAGHSI